MSVLIPPVLDLSPLEGSAPSSDAWRVVARQFDLAIRKHGVVYIANTGVPPALESSLRALASTFFSSSLEAKQKFSFAEKFGSEGYTCIGKETVSQTRGVSDGPRDVIESIMVFSDSSPACPPALRDVVAEYIGHMNRLLVILMQLTDVALGVPPPGLSAAFREPFNVLKLLNYPGESIDGKGNDGYGAHTDFSGFTLLSQDARPAFPAQGALQVLVDDEWRSVPPVQDALLINAGDLIQRWTNGAYISPVHRVVLAKNRTVPRLSLAYFTAPHDKILVEPLAECCSEKVPAKYEPVIAGEWLWEKVRQTGTATD